MRPAPFRPRETLDGKYRLLSALGEGGMGMVFAAEHRVTHRTFAVKLLTFASGPLVTERAKREAQAACRVRHDAVVEVYDVQLAGPQPYLVMDLLQGEPLHRYLARRGRLPLGEVLDLMTPVLDAAHRFHEARVVHRDLKPANLLLCSAPRRRLKILDFGVAKLQSLSPRDGASAMKRGAPPLTASGAVLGTPLYMPPEQFMGPGVDARADVFALGTILVEMLAGRLSYADAEPFRILERLATESLLARRERIERECQISPGLADVLARATAPDLGERIASARALGEELASKPTVRATARPAPADQTQPALSEPSPPTPAPSEPREGSRPASAAGSLAGPAGTERAAPSAPTTLPSVDWDPPKLPSPRLGEAKAAAASRDPVGGARPAPPGSAESPARGARAGYLAAALVLTAGVVGAALQRRAPDPPPPSPRGAPSQVTAPLLPGPRPAAPRARLAPSPGPSQPEPDAREASPPGAAAAAGASPPIDSRAPAGPSGGVGARTPPAGASAAAPEPPGARRREPRAPEGARWGERAIPRDRTRGQRERPLRGGAATPTGARESKGASTRPWDLL